MVRFEYALVATMAVLISGTLGLIIQSPDSVVEESGVDLKRTGVPGGLTFAAPGAPAPLAVPVAAAGTPEPGSEPRMISLDASDKLTPGEGGPAPEDAGFDGTGMAEGGESPKIEASDTVEFDDKGSEMAGDRPNTIEASDTVEFDDKGSEMAGDRPNTIDASDTVSVGDKGSESGSSGEDLRDTIEASDTVTVDDG